MLSFEGVRKSSGASPHFRYLLVSTSTFSFGGGVLFLGVVHLCLFIGTINSTKSNL